MATLMLAGHPGESADLEGTAVLLGEWLQDDWAILFSHPDDFVRCELELDRWLVVMRQAFAASCIRPLALAKSTGWHDCGWVTQVNGDASAVVLPAPAGRCLDTLDMYAGRLREEIRSMDRRFVMIIDSSQRRRKTYAYDVPDRLPSPLDIVRWAHTLRDVHTPQEPPAYPLAGYPAARPHRYWPEALHGQSAA